MRIEFDVKITAKVLYNYMLYHNYKSFSGIFGTMVGAFMILGYTVGRSIPLLIAGLIVLFYTPYTLFMKSRQQSLKPQFKTPLHYVMTDEGLSVSQGEAEEFQAWGQMVKAVSTPTSIILYTSKVNAAIFPRADLGMKEMKVIEMISTHMTPDKVKIKS